MNSLSRALSGIPWQPPSSSQTGRNEVLHFGEVATDVLVELERVIRPRDRGLQVADHGVDASELSASVLVLRTASYCTENEGTPIIRNRYRPMSVAERAFVDTFDSVWSSLIKGGNGANMK
jgi:hypothetical protein